MSLSIIVPSIGRPSLEYTVASILSQLVEGDELIVVGARKPGLIKPKYDIRDDFKYIYRNNVNLRGTESGYASGAVERDMGRAVATGSHILVIDDDDIFLPGSFDLIRKTLGIYNPLDLHIFRAQYGCQKQWMSPFTKDLKQGVWRGFEEHQYVLFGPPLLEIGNVGAMMCVLPSNEFLGKWDCSAPGGIKNVNEDFWIARNYVEKSQRRPLFHPHVIGIIKPTPRELKDILDIDVPLDYQYAAQPGIWDGRP